MTASRQNPPQIIYPSSHPDDAPYVLGLDLGSNSVGWAEISGRVPKGLKSFEIGELTDAGVRIFRGAMKTKGKAEKSLARDRRMARGMRRNTARSAMRTHGLFLLLVQHGLLPHDMSSFTKLKPKNPESRDALSWDALQVQVKQDIADALTEFKQKYRPKHPPYYEPYRKERFKLSQSRDRLLSALDRWLLEHPERHAPLGKKAITQRLPYLLRSKALDQSLEPWELGRALFQLAQQRGFQSNRRASRQEKKEAGPVKKAIRELEQEMQQQGSKTVGAHLARVNPLSHRSTKRIRGRHAGRDMFKTELARIWRQQSKHHPKILTAEFRRQVNNLIFYQRPLKSAKHLVGLCTLAPTSPVKVWTGKKNRSGEEERRKTPLIVFKGKRRLVWANPLAQRFRILQKVNDLRIRIPGNPQMLSLHPEESPELRKIVMARLSGSQKVSYDSLKKKLSKKLSLDGPDGIEFNLEKGGEKNLRGNSTAAILGSKKALGGAWNKLSCEKQEQLVNILRATENDRRSRNVQLRKHYGFDDEQIKKLAVAAGKLERGYCRFSRETLEKWLLPPMEGGASYQEAESQAYPNAKRASSKSYSLLPPVAEMLTDIRNPAVSRTLSEMRSVVNAIINKKKGKKPYQIRVELARELKKPKVVRDKISKAGRKREELRKTAKSMVERLDPQTLPSRDDVEKAMLFIECDGISPYTGKKYSFERAMRGALQIEHILPFSKIQDDSFANKTLCEPAVNNQKNDRLPWHLEADGDLLSHSEIIAYAASFEGTYRDEKLRRFTMGDKEFEKFKKDFTSRQLNDTAYASKLATKYLACLYGGAAHGDQKSGYPRRILTSSGGVTARVRNELELSSVLGKKGEKKSRDDHRHHAVDAFVISMTSDHYIEDINSYTSGKHASRMKRVEYHEQFPRPPGWENKRERAVEKIKGIITSHRTGSRTRGALHEDTNYKSKEAKISMHRQPVNALLSAALVKKITRNSDPTTVKDLIGDSVKNIIDNAVRDAVKSCLEKFFLTNRSGSLKDYLKNCPPRLSENSPPIRKVRVKIPKTTEIIISTRRPVEK